MSEEIVYRKLISNARTSELENLDKSSYKTKYKWEHKKLVHNGEEEEIM
jgi:hypothetical protein